MNARIHYLLATQYCILGTILLIFLHVERVSHHLRERSIKCVLKTIWKRNNQPFTLPFSFYCKPLFFRDWWKFIFIQLFSNLFVKNSWKFPVLKLLIERYQWEKNILYLSWISALFLSFSFLFNTSSFEWNVSKPSL